MPDENMVLAGHHKMVLRPVLGLVRDLPLSAVEQLTIDAIKTHRRLLREADTLYEAQLARSDHSESEASDIKIDIPYITAMIAMQSQMTVLSTLLDVLGFIPNVASE